MQKIWTIENRPLSVSFFARCSPPHMEKGNGRGLSFAVSDTQTDMNQPRWIRAEKRDAALKTWWPETHLGFQLIFRNLWMIRWWAEYEMLLQERNCMQLEYWHPDIQRSIRKETQLHSANLYCNKLHNIHYAKWEYANSSTSNRLGSNLSEAAGLPLDKATLTRRDIQKVLNFRF